MKKRKSFSTNEWERGMPHISQYQYTACQCTVSNPCSKKPTGRDIRKNTALESTQGFKIKNQF